MLPKCNGAGVKQRVTKPAQENSVLTGKQADEVLKKMRRAGEPQTEGQEELAIVLGHRRDNPDRGQQAVEQERPKHDVAQRIRDGGSGAAVGAGAVTISAGATDTVAAAGSVLAGGRSMAICSARTCPKKRRCFTALPSKQETVH